MASIWSYYFFFITLPKNVAVEKLIFFHKNNCIYISYLGEKDSNYNFYFVVRDYIEERIGI